MIESLNNSLPLYSAALEIASTTLFTVYHVKGTWMGMELGMVGPPRTVGAGSGVGGRPKNGPCSAGPMATVHAVPRTPIFHLLSSAAGPSPAYSTV